MASSEKVRLTSSGQVQMANSEWVRLASRQSWSRKQWQSQSRSRWWSRWKCRQTRSWSQWWWKCRPLMLVHHWCWRKCRWTWCSMSWNHSQMACIRWGSQSRLEEDSHCLGQNRLAHSSLGRAAGAAGRNARGRAAAAAWPGLPSIPMGLDSGHTSRKGGELQSLVHSLLTIVGMNE